MHNTPIPSWSALLKEGALSRRHFLRAAAGTAGGILGASLLLPNRSRADDDNDHNDDHDDDIVLPKPIPLGTQFLGEGTELFHFYLPPDNEPSTIFDFDGAVGLAEHTGTGTAKDTKTGETTPLYFITDFRFMQGKYIGEDGRQHHGTFSFF
jgi:hypothetical protein